MQRFQTQARKGSATCLCIVGYVVNAARNILARGIAQLVIGSAAVQATASEAGVNKAQAEGGSDLSAERESLPLRARR